MPVTELAILHLSPGATIDNEPFRAKLQRTIQVMQNALGGSGRRFAYYHDVGDPQVLFLLGDWESPSEHWDQFIPSPENQQLLVLLQDDVDIPSIRMYHVGVPNAEVPMDTQFMSVEWCRVRKEDRVAFESRARVQGGKPAAAGWRIERDPDMAEDEEFILFRGWRSSDEASQSGTLEAVPRDERTRGLLQSHQAKLGIRIDLGEAAYGS